MIKHHNGTEETIKYRHYLTKSCHRPPIEPLAFVESILNWKFGVADSFLIPGSITFENVALFQDLVKVHHLVIQEWRKSGLGPFWHSHHVYRVMIGRYLYSSMARCCWCRITGSKDLFLWVWQFSKPRFRGWTRAWWPKT